MFTFNDPWVLGLIAVVPLYLVLIYLRPKGAPIRFSSSSILGDYRATAKQRFSSITLFMRSTAIVLMLIALARPQIVLSESKTVSEGVDIVLNIDTSTSMLAEDFKMGGKRVNRFDVVKEVVKDFISKRHDDRIGMIAFAQRAYTVCPLTTDYEWLYENLDRVRIGMIEDATAIGSALASSLNRLRSSKTKSKVVILLTDGINNAGTISPIAAAEAAKALKVKVYTIGVGTKGLVPYPFKDVYGRTVYQNIPIDIDDESLRRIAEITGGRYYRAQDTESLREIYDDINKLERSNIEHYGYRETTELYHHLLIPALVMLLLEIALGQTVFKRVP